MKAMFYSLLASALLPLAAQSVDLEYTHWTSHLNEVRKPATGGTTVELGQLVGNGPVHAFRLDAAWSFRPRHEVRVLLAPFEVSGNGRLKENVQFEGHTFVSGADTRGLYRFNSWRLTWRYQWVDNESWLIKVGATAKVRDAKIELSQLGRTERTTNVGFVPLLHGFVQYRLNPQFSVVLDADAMAAPQGRAVDVAAMLRWNWNPNAHVDLGYRMLEGGADNDKLYTWARLDAWRVGVGYRF